MAATGRRGRPRAAHRRGRHVARVAELLGSDPDLPFDLEMTGVAPNHFGETAPGKVQLATDAEPAVLAHELPHARAMTGNGAVRNQGSRACFDEGLEVIDRTPHGEPWTLVCRFRQDDSEPYARYEEKPVIVAVCTGPVRGLGGGGGVRRSVRVRVRQRRVVLMPWGRLPLVASRDR